MDRIIKRLVNEAVGKIKDELTTINKDIQDYNLPVTPENLQEKIDGRLSTQSLQNNHERKLRLENELHDLKNFIYQNKNLMEA